MTTSQIRQIFFGYYYLSAIRLHAERFSHLKNDRSHFTIADFRQFNYKKYEWNIIWDAIRKLLFKTRPDQDIGGIPDILIRPCLLTGKTKKFSEITFMFIGSTIKGFSLCPIFFYISKSSIAPLETYTPASMPKYPKIHEHAHGWTIKALLEKWAEHPAKNKWKHVTIESVK